MSLPTDGNPAHLPSPLARPLRLLFGNLAILALLLSVRSVLLDLILELLSSLSRLLQLLLVLRLLAGQALCIAVKVVFDTQLAELGSLCFLSLDEAGADLLLLLGGLGLIGR